MGNKETAEILIVNEDQDFFSEKWCEVKNEV